MFGEFQLKITTVSGKTVNSHFCENPQKMGVSRNGEFFTFPEFSRRNVYLAKSTLLEDANSEKRPHKSKNSLCGSLSKMAKNDQKWSFF